MVIGFASVTVGSFVYHLGFVGKFLHFEMFEFVGVFVYNILGYMVQKYLVENNHHHRIINCLYSRVFVVYFYFVGKMDSFHYELVGDMDDLESLLVFVMYLDDSIFVKIKKILCISAGGWVVCDGLT